MTEGSDPFVSELHAPDEPLLHSTASERILTSTQVRTRADSVDADAELRLLQAATLITDATYQRSKFGHGFDEESLRYYKLYFSWGMQALFLGAAVVNCCTVFFEHPSSLQLSTPIVFSVEAATICVFMFQIAWIYKCLEHKSRIYQDRKHMWLIIIIAVTILDGVLFLAIPAFKWRPSRLARPYFIIYNARYVRRAIRNIRRSLVPALSIVALLFIYVGLWALLMTLVFVGTEEGNTYFPNPWAAFISLYVLLSTANYPDVMMPAYDANPFNFAPFLIFVSLGVFVLSSFVLAVVYNQYALAARKEENEIRLAEREAVDRAFDLLTMNEDDDLCDEVLWGKLMAELVPDASPSKIYLLWKAMIAQDKANDDMVRQRSVSVTAAPVRSLDALGAVNTIDDLPVAPLRRTNSQARAEAEKLRDSILRRSLGQRSFSSAGEEEPPAMSGRDRKRRSSTSASKLSKQTRDNTRVNASINSPDEDMGEGVQDPALEDTGTGYRSVRTVAFEDNWDDESVSTTRTYQPYSRPYRAGIPKRQFRQIVTLLGLSVTAYKGSRAMWGDGINLLRNLRHFLRSQAFENVVNLNILVNVTLVTIDVSFKTGTSIDNISFNFTYQVVFSVLMLIETTLRVYALGPRGFWQSKWQRFDLLVLIIALAAVILNLSGLADPRLYQYLILLRVLRLGTVIMQVPQFRIVGYSLVNLGPALMTYTTITFCICFVYAVVGQWIFGGKIYADNPKLKGTPFADDDYYANSFNTMGAAMVTLFELMVVNNWQVIVSGYVAVTSTLAWLYFLSFNALVVLIILNIVVAFIIDAFILEYDSAATVVSDLETRILASTTDQDDIVWTVHTRQDLRFFLRQLYWDDDEEDDDDVDDSASTVTYDDGSDDGTYVSYLSHSHL